VKDHQLRYSLRFHFREFYPAALNVHFNERVSAAVSKVRWGMRVGVLLLLWFTVYEDSMPVRWGGFETRAACEVLLQIVAAGIHALRHVPALSREY
jgi:hypothetical protein